jgi:glutathione S-transferase/alpha,alpha-trehalase
VDRRAPSYPHPFGSVPAALDDGGVQLFESGAILLFIADKYGGLDTPEKRAAVTKWVMWANASLDPICFGGESFVTKLTGSPKAVGVLDGILGKSKWLLGDEFSVADVAVASYLLYALQFFPQVKFASKYPNISKYCNTCAKRPAYIKAFGASVANKLADRAIA